MDWPVFRLPATCLALAILELDSLCVGQWMISRPMIIGPILGGFLGNFGIGVWTGTALEFLLMDDLPVGHRLPLNGMVVTACVLILSGKDMGFPLAAALPAGFLLGKAFVLVDSGMRLWSKRFLLEASSPRSSGRDSLGSLMAQSLGIHVLTTGVFLYGGVLAVGAMLGRIWPALPKEVRLGLDLGAQGAPWLAIASLFFVFRRR